MSLPECSAEVRKARSLLAIKTRFRGADHPETAAARRGLTAAKLALARTEVTRLQAELDAYRVPA